MFELIIENAVLLGALGGLVAVIEFSLKPFRRLFGANNQSQTTQSDPVGLTRFPTKDDDHKESVRAKDEDRTDTLITTQAKMIDFLEARILDREDEIARIRADDANKHAAQIKLLEAEIAELRARLADPERGRAEFEEARKEASDDLEREANTLGADRVKAAEDAMANGDFAAAKALFQEIKNEEELAEQRSARASYALGKIAEAEVRWSDAADHFARAAELNDDFEHLFKAREYAWRAGRLPEALALGEKMLAVTEGKIDKNRSQALHEHAQTLESSGRYGEAESLYREALEIGRAVHGNRHSNTAIQINNLANLLQATGRYAEAEPLYNEALELTRESLGVRHPDYAIWLNNLAVLLETLGRHEEAEPLYHEALEIGRETLGEQHPDYAARLNNLANLLRATGRYKEAEPLYREAKKISREMLGRKHPDYAIDLNNLASLLQATGRHEEAGPLYREALQICEEALGPDHPNTQIARANLDGLLDEGQ